MAQEPAVTTSTRSVLPAGGVVSEAAGGSAGGADAQFRTLVEGMPQLVWRSSDMGHWTWSSPQWLAFTGQDQEQSHGRGWMDAVCPEDHEATMAAWAAARPHGMLDVEFRVREAATGDYLWHRTRSAPAFDTEGRIVEWLGTTTNVQDLKVLQLRQAELLQEAEAHGRALEAEIERRKAVEDQLSYTAFHDELTKLHNRAFFMGQLRRALSGKDRGAGRCAVLIMDLDRFKLVNDSLGHRAGDMLLTAIAGRLARCLGQDATLARIGGDEFGIVVDGIAEAELPQMAQRLLEAVRRPLCIGARQIVSSCSLGATWLTDRHGKPEDVLQEADAAMYLAKRRSPGHFLLFEPAMLNRAAEALDIRNDLNGAVARGEFELHFQPIVEVASGVVTGFEALVRWQNPRLGLLPPGVFIPVAEECGLVAEIGRWVLTEGCGQLRRWRELYPGLPLGLSVNVCSEELKDPAFLPAALETLAQAGVEPNLLEFEITEGIFLEHSETVLHTLAALRQHGVRIAIDDFGTGYSSLSYLDRYEVDTVKIDRSFVFRMLTEARTRPVMEAVLGLGRALLVRVVAEGVETEQQLHALADMSCDAVQGYLLARPGPAGNFMALLDERYAQHGMAESAVRQPGR